MQSFYEGDETQTKEKQKNEIDKRASIENADLVLLNLDGYDDFELQSLIKIEKLEEVEEWCNENDDHKKKCDEMARLVNTPIEYEELMQLDAAQGEPTLDDYLMELNWTMAMVFEYMKYHPADMRQFILNKDGEIQRKKREEQKKEDEEKEAEKKKKEEEEDKKL